MTYPNDGPVYFGLQGTAGQSAGCIPGQNTAGQLGAHVAALPLQAPVGVWRTE